MYLNFNPLFLFTAGKRELLSRKWRRAKRVRRYYRLLGAVLGRGVAARGHGVLLASPARPGAAAVAVPLLTMLGIQVGLGVYLLFIS